MTKGQILYSHEVFSVVRFIESRVMLSEMGWGQGTMRVYCLEDAVLYMRRPLEVGGGYDAVTL